MESPALRRATRPAIDVWHEVPLVPQLTGMSCWAAAAAMVIGWRDRSALDAPHVAHRSGRWHAYEGGLEPLDVPALARRWGLTMVPARRHGVKEFARLLTESGPLWVGEASPGLHSVVVCGMRGDGTLDGTVVHIADPWPAGRGERYKVSFRDFMSNVQAAADLEGVDAQILHAGGRAHALDFADLLPAKRVELDCPLLASHGGPGPNLILRWNFTDDVSPIDVVVHLHGFRDEQAAMRLPSVEVMSGLDFADPTLPAGSASSRVRPTLAILPRGKWIGDGRHFSQKAGKIVDNDPRAYAFPALTEHPEVLGDLIRYALDWMATVQLLRSDPNTMQKARLILTAHSGGGAALEKLLSVNDPDEVHTFDALYSASPNLAAWARRHLRADALALAGADPASWDDRLHASGGALRVFYLFAEPGHGTRDASRALHEIVSCTEAAQGDPNVAAALRRYYRVEGISSDDLGHMAMPPTLGWQLLGDAAADVTPPMTPLPTPSASECRTILRALSKERPMSNGYASHRPYEADVARLLAQRVVEHVGPDLRARLQQRPSEIDTIARAAAGAIRAQVAATTPSSARARIRGRPLVRPLFWSPDADSPDYSHIGVAGDSTPFTLDATVLQTLCDLNAFDVSADPDKTGVVLFGLRGCSIVDSSTAGAFVASVQLADDIPDHETNHCVLGVWKVSGTDAGKIAVVRGSTVPTLKFMKAFAADPENADKKCNMLLTGKIPYVIGTHRASSATHRLKGVFHESPDPVVVVRSLDDDVYTKKDFFEAAHPGDNIHPSRFLASEKFSSKGCQTIPGSGDAAGNQFESHTPPGWLAFRTRAGLTPASAPSSENGKHFTYILLTGREAKLVFQAAATVPAMKRLRFGSSGTAVSALQTKLGITATGTMDAATTMAWIRSQQTANGGAADGIVKPSDASAMGFSL